MPHAHIQLFITCSLYTDFTAEGVDREEKKKAKERGSPMGSPAVSDWSHAPQELGANMAASGALLRVQLEPKWHLGQHSHYIIDLTVGGARGL